MKVKIKEAIKYIYFLYYLNPSQRFSASYQFDESSSRSSWNAAKCDHLQVKAMFTP